METNISIEAGAEDPVIVVPWTDPSGRLQYVEPRQGMAWIDQIVEAREWPEVREMLLAIHAVTCLSSVKCDAWVLSEAELELDFGPVAYGFGAYFDVVDRDPVGTPAALRVRAEQWSRSLCAAEIEGRCDFVIRPARIEEQAMYAMTMYVFGYGGLEQQARKNWAAALQKVAAVLAEC